MFGKILVILTLIKNVIIRKTRYTLHFFSETDSYNFKSWFYDWNRDHLFKWSFKKENLTMVSGADDLCELFCNGNKSIEISIIAKNKLDKSIDKSEYYIYKRQPLIEVVYKGNKQPLIKGLIDKYAFGATYDCDENMSIWICPVTLFVLGRYPKYLYIKKSK